MKYERIRMLLGCMVILMAFVVIILTIMSFMGSGIETADESNLIVGTGVSTTLSDTYTSNDVYYEYNETTGTPGSLLELNFTVMPITSNTVIQIDLEYYYNGSAGHNLDLELFDGTSYIIVYNLSETVGDNSIRDIRNIPSTYFQSGELWFRFNHTSPGNINHGLGIDLFTVSYDISLDKDFDMLYASTSNNLDLNSYNFYTNDFTCTFDDLIINSGGYFWGNNTVSFNVDHIIIDGGGTLKAPSGNLITSGVDGSNYEFKNSGTYIHNSGTITFNYDGNRYIQSNGDSFYNVIMDGRAFIEILITTFSISNDFTLNLGSVTDDMYMLSRTLDVEGDMFINRGDIQFYTGGRIDCEGNVYVGVNGAIENTGHAGTTTISVLGNFVNNGTVTGLTSSGAWDFGTLTINSGSFSSTSGTLQLKLPGNSFYRTGGTFAHRNGKVYLNIPDLDAYSNIYWNGGSGNFYDVDINYLDGARASRHRGNVVIENDLTIIEGLFERIISTQTLTINGHVTIENGGILGNVDVTGNRYFGELTIESGGTYRATSGRTDINGDCTFISGYTFIHNNGEWYVNVGTLDYDVPGAIFYDLSFVSPWNSIQFQTNSAYTVLNDYIVEGGPGRAMYHSRDADATINYWEVDNVNIHNFLVRGAFTADMNIDTFIVGTGSDIDFVDNENKDIIIDHLDINSGATFRASIDELTIKDFYSNNGTFIDNGGVIEFTDNLIYFNPGTDNIDIIGTFKTVNLNDSTFVEDNANIVLSGTWEVNTNLSDLRFNSLVVKGTMRYDLYSTQSSNNLEIYLKDNSFRTSTGEINLTANVNYPLRLIGVSNGTTIDFSNTSDYYLINIEAKNLTNIDTEYITIHGNDLGNLYGLWDFTPPLITYLNLSEGSNLIKVGDNLYNFSFYLEELSYIHSYNWTITHKGSNTLFASGQFNFSSATNHTTKVQFYNITFWFVGEYWFNITCFDTHNKLSEKAINKELVQLMKITDGTNKVGKYDKHISKLISKDLRMYNYISNSTIYTLEFMNTKNETHNIYWNDGNENFKMDYILELKDNYVEMIIKADNIIYIPESHNFVVGEMYFYDISDFLLTDGNYLRVSNLMKDKDYDYYIIEFHNDSWSKDMIITIDPLSGMVNNGFDSINITVSGQTLVYGDISLENSTSYYEDIGNTYYVDITYTLTNISKYIFTSSKDGEFYNSSLNWTYNNNLSAGLHNIQIKVMDELFAFTIIDNVTVYVIKKPIASISNINPMGQIVIFTGTYTQIENNTIVRYVWRSSQYPTGPFYNGTTNPIQVINFAVGNHTIFFKIKDVYGRFSEEVNTTVFVLNVTVEEIGEDTDIWYQNSTNFLNVYGFVMVLSFATIVIYTVIKRRYL